MDYLSGNPKFAQFISELQQENVLGVPASEVDDETKKALEMVQKISQQTTETEINRIRKEEITPLVEALKERTIDEHFTSMDEKYANWREMQDKMSELTGNLPDNIADSPSFGDIEDLYFKALRETGKFDDYAAEIYQKKLTDKKNKSEDKPTSAGAESQPKDASSFDEAYQQAKKQLGIG
jgi:hypothetical protein